MRLQFITTLKNLTPIDPPKGGNKARFGLLHSNSDQEACRLTSFSATTSQLNAVLCQSRRAERGMWYYRTSEYEVGRQRNLSNIRTFKCESQQRQMVSDTSIRLPCKYTTQVWLFLAQTQLSDIGTIPVLPLSTSHAPYRSGGTQLTYCPRFSGSLGN